MSYDYLMLRFASTNREFLQEKFFSFPLSLLFILILSPQGVGVAYLILGHAHFMMTLLYQYKMGRIGWRNIVFYILMFEVLFIIAHVYPNAFTVFVASCLLLHVYFGEARHIKESFSPSYLLMSLGIMTLISSWLAIKLWHLQINGMLVLVMSSLVVGLACIAFLRHNRGLKVEYLFVTLLLLYFFFVFLELSGNRPSPLDTFGFIVIAHYFATYFNVFRSFTRKGGGKQWVFVLESLLMNMLFLGGFMLVFFYLGKDNPLYYYVYQPISFYVWTLMHFITTMDFTNYKNRIVGLFRGSVMPMPQFIQAESVRNPMDEH